MSTPQDPGGDKPQDPQDPQNPYGTPPPPPTDPAAPVTPPTTPPPPAYDAPAAPADPAAPPPPYGQPTAPTDPAAAPPAYGQPAYGQPAYGQPAYPQPGQPGQPVYPQYAAPAGSEEPSKGLAIGALILSFLACTLLLAIPAIIMAIVVLLKGRDGRNHGKGLAIAALIISAISVIGTIVGGGALYNYASQFESVNDLKTGQCITAKGLTDENADSVTEIKSVSCSSSHDGEVLATVELTADQAESYTDTQSEDICGPAIEAEGKTALLTADITVTALTVADPAKGDNVACVAYHADGSKLTGKIGS